MKRCLCILVFLMTVFRRPLGEVLSKGWDIIREIPILMASAIMWIVSSWRRDLRWRAIFIAILVCLLVVVVRKIVLFFCRRYASANVDCLVTDEPIDKEDEDRLGRIAYVRTILTLLDRAEPYKSQVVGIYGKWGEGKTSAVKLLESICKRQKKQSFRFVWFMPWSSVVRNDINADMFVAIQAAIRKYNPIVALVMLQYACRQTIHLMPESNGILELMSVLLASMCNFFTSPDTVKASLKKKLLNMSRRIVVVIDDIDRLTCDEVGEVVRCLKTNGDLPNVTYLVLANETLLSEMIRDRYCHGNGTRCVQVMGDGDFLEKIVTYPMPLWPTPRETLMRELKRLTVGVLSRYSLASGEIGDREYDFAMEKCENLRSIKRLTIGFDLVLAYYQGPANDDCCGFNIHIGDAFCLSAVRLFSPDSLNVIFSTYATWVRHDMSKTLTSYNVGKSDFDAFMEQMSSRNKEWIQRFVREILFVHEVDGKSGKEYEPIAVKDAMQGIAKGFRLASPYHFARYFVPSELPHKIVPRDVILNYFRNAHDIEKFKTWFNVIAHNYGLINFLDAVRNCRVSVTYAAPLDVAVVTDWILSIVWDFVADDASSNSAMDYACLIMAEYFERVINAGLMEMRDAPVIANWIIMNKSYSLCCYWLGRGVGQFEPEDSFAAEPSKIGVEEAAKLWRWVKGELHCKVFDNGVVSRRDAEFLQRLWNWLVMFKCPIDGSTFKEHRDYLCRSMDSDQCMQRLKSLGRYEYDIASGVGKLEYQYYMNNYRETYIKIFMEAEKAFVKYADKMTRYDCDIYSAACKNIQTPLSQKADQVVERIRSRTEK